MQLPIAIHKDEDSVYGVIIPDVPGCYSWGNSIDQAIQNCKEAIKGHLEILLELGDPLTIQASRIENLLSDPVYAGAIWALVQIDLSQMTTAPERVNISLPRYILRRIDNFVKANHETRSGFLARAALIAIANNNLADH